MLELKTDWQGNIFIRFSARFSPFAYTRFGIFEEIGLLTLLISTYIWLQWPPLKFTTNIVA
jgi:hypothetical protein